MLNKKYIFLILIIYLALLVFFVKHYSQTDAPVKPLQQLYQLFENKNKTVIEKSEEIEKNFVDFSEYFISYLKIQNSIPKKSRKYLVFIPQTWFGWGNTIRALGSAFLFSLLSERIFLIDWKHDEYDLESVIQDPFQNLRDPNDIDYPSGWWYDENIHGKISKTLDVLEIEDKKFLFEGNYTMLTETVIGITSFSPFWRAIQRNPKYAVIIRKLFGFNTISPLVRFLIHPSPRIQIFIENMREKFGTNFVLGVQLRTKNKVFPLEEDAKNRFLECVNLSVDYANKGEDGWLSKRPVTIYMSTDDADLLDLWKSKNILMWEGPIKHLAHYEAENFKDVPSTPQQELDKVFLDWYMLGEADILLSSHCSSFGETAFVRGTPQTYFLPSSKGADTNCGYTFGWPRWCSNLYKDY